MLKQITLFLIPALFSINSLQAHFLWRINTEKPSYLYGTVHSSDPSVQDIPVEVVEALRKCVSFHPELEFSPENMGSLTAAMFPASPVDLEKDIPPALWERLEEASRSAGIPKVLLRRIPLQLVPLLFATPPGADFNKIVDVQVYQMARENNLVIRQLETVDEQINLFRNLKPEEAVHLIQDALKEREDGFPTQRKIIRLYANSDLKSLGELLEKELTRLDIEKLAEALIIRRNEKMAERLLPYLQDGGAFAAVGVGHMPGEHGILSLLEKQGYEINRLPLEGGH